MQVGNGMVRFVKYTFVGGLTFTFDLLLLYILVDVVGLYIPISAGVAYLVAVSVNYLFSRRYVFQGSLRSTGTGYMMFLTIALSGLLMVSGGMYLLVFFYAVPYIYARVLIAGVAGMYNYLLNLYVNFQVAGKHLEEEH